MSLVSAGDEIKFDVEQWIKTHPQNRIEPIPYRQPTRIGLGWTKNDAALYSYNDATGLPLLCIPPPNSLPNNLHDGLDSFIEKDQSHHAGVEILLHQLKAASDPSSSFLFQQHAEDTSSQNTAHMHIITFRNNLNKLFGIPFNPKKSWKIAACYIQSINTIFFDIVNNAPSQWENTEEGKKLTAFGYIFESMVTVNRQTGRKESANPNSEYGMLVRAKIGGKQEQQQEEEGKEEDEGIVLYIGAEIDAYEEEETTTNITPPHNNNNNQTTSTTVPPLHSLCEIKTYKKPTRQSNYWNLYKNKHPIWWLQSFLAGVNTLVLGQRDEDGNIHEIHKVAVKDLSKISKNSGCAWNHQVALRFGYDALNWIKHIAAIKCKENGGESSSVLFEYRADERKIYALAMDEEGDGVDDSKKGQSSLYKRIQGVLG